MGMTSPPQSVKMNGTCSARSARATSRPPCTVPISRSPISAIALARLREVYTFALVTAARSLLAPYRMVMACDSSATTPGRPFAHRRRAHARRRLPSGVRGARAHGANRSLRRARTPQPRRGGVVAPAAGACQSARALAAQEAVELLELDQPALRILGNRARYVLRRVLQGLVHGFRW